MNRAGRPWLAPRAWIAVAVVLGVPFALGHAGCLDRRDDAAYTGANQCTRCHGDRDAGADPDASNPTTAAPPYDLAGNTDQHYPGVGAHQRHLSEATIGRKVECHQCHVVPTNVVDNGHFDNPAPDAGILQAKLTFGELATQRDAIFDGGTGDGGLRSPAYDRTTYSCTDTYCHRGAAPVWIQQRSAKDACGTCHSLPPPFPHTASKQCFRCHTEVVDPACDVSKACTIIDPDKHVNGTVDVVNPTCHTCHGDKDAGADLDASNPITAAPPRDLAGDTTSASAGVGAHQAHLKGGTFSRPVTCGECHIVPQNIEDPNHIHNTGQAVLTFSGPVALAQGAQPVFDAKKLTCQATWCHGPVFGPNAPDGGSQSPIWTYQKPEPLPCTTCHGYPPAEPHIQMDRCSLCHTHVNPDNKTFKDRNLHVDGIKEFPGLPVDDAGVTNCHGCHGSDQSNAPPTDIDGGSATTETGVGAHQKHLTGTMIARRVLCNECHIVPTAIDSPGHTDTPLPAELTFSGVATAWSAAPAWDGMKCANTYCHSPSIGGADAGGGKPTPVWTAGAGQTGCAADGTGSCHSLPPPAPHPPVPGGLPACIGCHHNMDATGLGFQDAGLHVNGVVNF